VTARTLGILLTLVTALARGQSDSSLSPATASLTLRSTPSGAKVSLDGTERGVTPLDLPALPPGRYVVRIADPDTANWLACGVLDTVVLGGGEERVLHYTLGGWLLLSTIPSGAGVYVGDSLAGTTPLLLRQSVGPHTQFTVAREGYATVLASREDFRRGTLLLTLTPGAGGAFPAAASEIVPPPPSPVPLYITGISAVVSGVAAAYCKARADEASDEFVRTRSPALLSERDRYDTIAAISIVVMEASLGLLVYFLISR